MYVAYIVFSIIILLVMVLVHELGHYTAAKILGFEVEEFSIGFGPKIISKVMKSGERFSLRALPLGGYCAFFDDIDGKSDAQSLQSTEKTENVAADADENNGDEKEDLLSYVMRSKIDEERATVSTIAVPKSMRLDKNGNVAKKFYEQKPWKRIIVLFGGVVFNFLSAIIFAFVYIWAVGCPAKQVADVYADATGRPYSQLQKGDIIIAINNKNISVMDSFDDLTGKYAEDRIVTFKVNRNGAIVDVEMKKQRIAAVGDDGKPIEYVGFGFASDTAYIGADIGQAFFYCVPYTFKLSWAILGSFGQLFTGKVPITSMTGPVGSVKLMADITIADWRNVLILLPLLASNLAMFNLLPFPALDGAQVIFTVLEWVRGKPLKREIQGVINAVGLCALLLFVAVVDILSFAL